MDLDFVLKTSSIDWKTGDYAVGHGTLTHKPFFKSVLLEHGELPRDLPLAVHLNFLLALNFGI